MLVLSGSDAFMEGSQNRKLEFRLREDCGRGHNLEGADIALLCYLGEHEPIELPCLAKNARQGSFETQLPVAAPARSSFKITARIDRRPKNSTSPEDKPISSEFSSSLTVWVLRKERTRGNHAHTFGR